MGAVTYEDTDMSLDIPAVIRLAAREKFTIVNNGHKRKAYELRCTYKAHVIIRDGVIYADGIRLPDEALLMQRSGGSVFGTGVAFTGHHMKDTIAWLGAERLEMLRRMIELHRPRIDGTLSVSGEQA